MLVGLTTLVLATLPVPTGEDGVEEPLLAAGALVAGDPAGTDDAGDD